MKHLTMVLVLIGVATTGFLSGTAVGRETATKSGYDKGYSQARSDTPQKTFLDFPEYNNLSSNFDKVVAENEKLVKDYNVLVQYANTPKYQPRQPIYCSSMSYGMNNNFTSTNCY